MAKNKTAKNLISNRSEYSAYYGDFRGVDFSSDHSLVSPNRFAYLVNMYKDYQSANGTAIETIPGFRKRFVAPDMPLETPIYAIHKLGDKVFVHAGSYWVPWNNYPNSCGVVMTANVILGDPVSVSGDVKTFQIDISDVAEQNGGKAGGAPAVKSIKLFGVEVDGENVKEEDLYPHVTNNNDKTCSFSSSLANAGMQVLIEYMEDSFIERQTFSHVASRKSVLIPTSKGAVLLDGEKLKVLAASKLLDDISTFVHIPTTYKGIVVSGENANGGYEYEQRNLLSQRFRNEFSGVVVGEENPSKLVLMAPKCTVEKVTAKYYGKEVGISKYTPLQNGDETSITIQSYGTNEDASYLNNLPDEEKAKIIFEVEAEYETSTEDTIGKCTIGCEFDNRFFVSGNPDFPNRVWFSKEIEDKLYFGANDWFDDGVGTVPVTGIIPVADKLLVLKKDTGEGGSVFLHSKVLTGENIVPVTYDREQGLNGIGCLGACANFFDDPVFVSSRGLEALGQLSLRNERALEHRSTLIDAKLSNMDLSHAFIEEWNGYLLLFVDGCMFMADSRQRYTDALGIVQYEWYFVDGVGCYEGQTLDEEQQVMVGGNFRPATCAKTMDNNIFFGTENGVVMSFNFDKRNSETFDFLPDWYTFDGRTILSGCALKMDNCGIPHLTKSTVKKSMVAKIKTFLASNIKVKVRTNREPYRQIARVNTAVFSFEEMDFSNFTFLTEDSGLIGIREKEKKWVEKQIYLFSDEPRRPFALFYLAYRYVIAGRYK